jgi:hypothetical protein
MMQEQIFATLDKMLENPKSKNFLNHLVRSYMPISNVSKVWDKPTSDFKCVLTKEPLICVGEILVGMQTEEFKNNLMTSMKTMFDENADKTTPMMKLIGEKKLGLTGKETTTFMSYPAYQVFVDWVLTKSLKGDKHINWLINGINRNAYLSRAENINDVDVQNKLNKINVSKSATFTLGDSNDALAQLKAKLEQNGG